MNLFFPIDTGLFCFTPYSQSIRKFCWLYLQNICRVSLLFITILVSFWITAATALLGFFASVLAPYSLFSIQQLVCRLTLSQTMILHKILIQNKSQILEVACEFLAHGLALHYPYHFFFFYSPSHLLLSSLTFLLFLEQAKHTLPQVLSTCFPRSAQQPPPLKYPKVLLPHLLQTFDVCANVTF